MQQYRQLMLMVSQASIPLHAHILRTVPEQYRCIDKGYSEILDHLRHSKPTIEMVNMLEHGRLLTTCDEIDDTKLLAVIRKNIASTFLTVSRNAVTRINNLVINNLFPDNTLLSTVQMDNEQPPTNVYQGRSHTRNKQVRSLSQRLVTSSNSRFSSSAHMMNKGS